MKTLLILTLITSQAFAQYSKPQLLARYGGIDAYNAPDGMICFSSEPQPTKEGIYLGCQSAEGSLMARWSPNFTKVATSSRIFSRPVQMGEITNWYEFDQAGVSKVFEASRSGVRSTTLKNLGTYSALIDSFLMLKDRSYVYRLQDEGKELLNWKNHQITSLYKEDIAYIFPPVTSKEGNFIAKIRREHTGENAPDELIFWDGKFQTILKDKEADSNSAWKSFRHQYAVDGNTIAFIGTDSLGEGIFLLKDQRLITVARAGREVASFDYFSPKLRDGVLVFRGMDHQKRKVVYLFYNHKLRPLLTQGDTILTDKGLARVDYQSQDALFYGSPGIGPTGEIVQQATLTDADNPNTLMGIGLLKFTKE
jgi:hypothetical protein